MHIFILILFGFDEACIYVLISSISQTLTFDGIPWPTVKPNAGVLPYMQIKLPGQVVQEPFQDRMKMWDEKLKK